jgi:hypothetical protein
MKFFLLALLLPLYSYAGTGSCAVSAVIVLANTAAAPQGAATIPLGNPSQASGGVFTIYAGDLKNATATDHYMPFYKNGVLYQVSNGKSAYCFAMTSVSLSSNINFTLMSATATFADNATTASLTGAKYQAGVARAHFQT